MNRRAATTFSVYGLLAATAAGTFLLPKTLTVPTTAAAVPPDLIQVTGPVRDFLSSHPDFGITEAALAGHYAWNVGPVLSPRRRPVFGGGGLQVVTQWHDQDGNLIAPYATDPGLPGGHFDVDVYDELSTSPERHTHEYDDTYDVSYIDIVNDPNLLYDSIVGAGYPNDLRVEFLNCHNGVGFFTFDAGAGHQMGTTLDGFTTVFDPATLTHLRVDFVSLHGLRATEPAAAKGDVADRDDSFTVRLFDTVTSAMVYEVCVYHHGDGVPEAGGGSVSGTDMCGDDFDDTAGSFGGTGDGGVTDSATFEQWFSDYMGTNLSQPLTLNLMRNAMGVYEYLTDDFYPIDNELLGNEGDDHNQYFTYTFSASFVYEGCADHFFEFTGNDDCWAYIDRRRVIDLGGVASPVRQYVAVDRLDLVDGETYMLDFFFAHRADSHNSVFRMRTTLPLHSAKGVLATSGFD